MPCSFEREPTAPSICREFRGKGQTLNTKPLGVVSEIGLGAHSPAPTRFAQKLSEVVMNKSLTTPAVRLVTATGRGLKRKYERPKGV